MRAIAAAGQFNTSLMKNLYNIAVGLEDKVTEGTLTWLSPSEDQQAEVGGGGGKCEGGKRKGGW